MQITLVPISVHIIILTFPLQAVPPHHTPYTCMHTHTHTHACTPHAHAYMHTFTHKEAGVCVCVCVFHQKHFRQEINQLKNGSSRLLKNSFKLYVFVASVQLLIIPSSCMCYVCELVIMIANNNNNKSYWKKNTPSEYLSQDLLHQNISRPALFMGLSCHTGIRFSK